MADLSDEKAFYYIDGMPTVGAWVTLEDITDEDDIKEILAEIEIIKRDADGDPVYDGDLLVACVDGEVAPHFLSKFDCFDLKGWREVCEEAPRHVSERAIAAYINWAGSWSLSSFEDAYQGEYPSELAYAEQLVDDLGYLNEMPESIRPYFDYEAFARDLFISDYWFEDGFVFNRNY